MHNSIISNQIYKNQFAIIAFMTMIVFKIAMLPKYLSNSSGSDAIFSVLVLLAIEVIMYIVVFFIARDINLLSLENKFFMVPIMLIIFVMSSMRGAVLYSELIDYSTTTLFDHNRSTFILLAFTPILAYFTYKGGTVLAKLSELVFYISIVTLVLMISIAKVDLDFDNFLPICEKGGIEVLNGIDKHFVWFGDYIPLLFFSIKKNNSKFLDKYSFPLCILGGVIFVLLFYVAFIGIYGEAGGIVNYAFNKIAIFNRLTELLGTTNYISVIAWLFMALMQLSLLLYSANVTLSYFIKNRIVALIINIGVMSIIQLLVIQNVDNAYLFAVSEIRYFIMVAQYLVPIAILLYAKLSKKALGSKNLQNQLKESPNNA